MTEQDWDQMLAQQDGRCAICRTTRPGGRGESWHIDHDGVTGQVRGLLCGACNTGIGLLKHDPDVIAAALRYVKRHRQMQLFGPEGPKLRGAAVADFLTELGGAP
jgi:hypothetical protein